MNIKQIIELHKQAIAQNQKYLQKRFIADDLLNDTGKHFVGLIGARGVGKSVLFKQISAITKDSIYISIDSIDTENLFELVKTLNEFYKYKVFFLDEIHFYRGYEKALKTIYDFLNVKVFFTSSVSLSLYNSVYDLARRIKIYNIYPFSYREYLSIKENIHLDSITIKEIKENKWNVEHIRGGHLFKDFICGGLMPFSLEEPDVLSMQKNILDKIIYRDIPLVAKLTTEELELIKKTVKFIGKAQIDGINYSTLSNNLKITKYKAEQYISLLEKAFVINVLFPEGTNVLKEPKIVMNLPYRLLYKEYEEAVGGLREDFFVECMKFGEKKINYLKTKKGKKTPDYLVDDNGKEYIIEVGGKGKGIQQFKGIDMSKSIIFVDGERLDGIRRPLFFAGFLK
ncbi:MAG: ATP-binding protein [Ignavibacteriae bacterium]|nr:ATP-binding protein [Ignavibacteriota bacterium]